MFKPHKTFSKMLFVTSENNIESMNENEENEKIYHMISIHQQRKEE